MYDHHILSYRSPRKEGGREIVYLLYAIYLSIYKGGMLYVDKIGYR